MKKDKAVFLDRDGTINVDKGYTHKVEDLEFIYGVVEGLKKLQDAGYKLIIITNQSGIGRGYYSEQDYFVFRDTLHRKLVQQGINIDAEYFCPHNPDENCNCRKPKTGMLVKVAGDFNLDLKECWMIGDSARDIQAGKTAGCRTSHVLTGEDAQPVFYADFIAEDLAKAADYILNNHTNK